MTWPEPNVEFSTLLEKTIAERVSKGRVALLLSGGVDSLSLGFAATRIGLTVRAYTFQVGEWSSPDSNAAERAAREMGWSFTLVKVPVDQLEQDFLALASKWECRKKTTFECTWPFLHVIPAIREKFVLSGIAADGHFGLSRKAQAKMRVVHSKEAFDAFRKDYFAQNNPAGQVQQRALIEAVKKVQVAPYLDGRILAYFERFSWSELNRPHQKMPVVKAYPNEFERVGRRDHANLQLVSGVDRIFLNLLKTPLNVKSRRRVMDLCRDYAK